MKRGGGKKRESVAAKCLSLSLSISLSISLCSLQDETVIIQRVDGGLKLSRSNTLCVVGSARAEAFRSTLPPLSSSGSLPSPPPPHHFELADGPRAAPGPRPGAVSQLEMNEEASSPLGR